MKKVYLSLGSNLGDRQQNLASAIRALSSRGFQITRQSSLYSTEPVGFAPQGWFLNCVVEGETDLMPLQLLRVVQEIERGLGRHRIVPRGPRALDLDILLFGSSKIQTAELEVPHPRMADRRFVLVPLAEMAPEARHPVLNKTISELLAETSDRSAVHLWKPPAETT